MALTERDAHDRLSEYKNTINRHMDIIPKKGLSLQDEP